MIGFFLRRLVASLLTLFAIATLSFVICRFAPGSPFTSEKHVPPEVRRNMERKYGLDQPLHIQYLRMMSGYVRGDLGPSYQHPGRDVSELLGAGLATSAQLGAIAFILALLSGAALGVVAASGQNRWPDYTAMSIATLGICVPNFLLGPILIKFLHYELGWLQPTGWPERWDTWTDLATLIMPAITLALVHVVYVSRLTRAGMLDVLHRDFIRTARAKGLSERAVVLKHALKNGITPALTYAGPMAAHLITGSIVVEKVFRIPGMGTHFVNSALQRDYAVTLGTVLVYSTLVIAFNFIVDVFYGVLDPRVRVSA